MDAITYAMSKKYTDNKVAISTGLHREIVNSLPSTGDNNTIYMVLDPNASSPDIYDEWLWVNGVYEHIGSTRVDLTDYYNKTQVDTALNGKANIATTLSGYGITDAYTKTETDTALSSKASTSDIPTTLASLSDDTTHRLVSDTEKNTWNGKANTSDIPTTLSSLSDDSTHRTVTDTEKSTWSGKADISDIPTKLSDFTNDSGFVTSTVNNLTNYYLKSETYTKAEVSALIQAITTLNIQAVSTLPTTDISTTTIYLVPKQDAQSPDVKDEYINLDGTTTGWELIGNTQIDLSNYVTTSDLNTALSTKQDSLTFDNVPTQNSNNPVKSGGIFSTVDDVFSVMGQMGAKNLLVPEWVETKTTEKGVTYTFNSDGTITMNTDASGATDNIDCNLRSKDDTTNNLFPAGSYILTGSPTGGSSTTYRMWIRAYRPNTNTPLTSNLYDEGNGVSFTVSEPFSLVLTAAVRKNYVCNNLTFKPMLRLAADINDDTYVQYAMTNKQLTEVIGDLTQTGVTGSSVSEQIGAIGEQIELLNYDGAGAHNSIYRGKNLGTALTSAQSDAIRNGSFDDLYIGDYWTINGTIYRIAAFDYWLHFGKTKCATHHVVIVPDVIMYKAKMNASDVTTGGYVGSAMYTTNLASAKTTIKADFGADHILTHQEYLTTQVSSGRPYSGNWYDSDIELMNEHMVYGKHLEAACDSTSGSTGNLPIIYTIDNAQLPLFALDHSKICIDDSWWLRDVLSETDFALVHKFGYCYNLTASIANGVRPAFGIY